MTDQLDPERLANLTASEAAASQRIETQHVALRERIAEIQKTLESQPDEPELIGTHLSTLSHELQAHFLEEEEGGFFDHIRQRAPQLSTDTKLLEEEHQEFLGRIRDLITIAETCEGSDPWWQRLKAEFHEYSKGLMHHESLENQLLQRAYNEDIGSHD